MKKKYCSNYSNIEFIFIIIVTSIIIPFIIYMLLRYAFGIALNDNPIILVFLVSLLMVQEFGPLGLGCLTPLLLIGSTITLCIAKNKKIAND